MITRPELRPQKRGRVHSLEDPRARSDGILVAFTDRRGGLSSAPYDSLNLAITVGDDRDSVLRNRAIVAEALGLRTDRMALARQIHGADLLEVPDGTSGVIGEADVLATAAPGQVISILTADCTPVAVAGRAGVALAHAGWRGVVGGAVERAVEWVGDARAAWVGPSIRACCYQVGRDVIDAFEERGLPIVDDSHVDPRDAAIAALQRSGVTAIAATELCTSCDPNYFSYRRDRVTGRQGAFVTMMP